MFGLAAMAGLTTSTCAQEPVSYDADGRHAQCDGTACRASLASASGNEALIIGRWKDEPGMAVGLATPRTIVDRERPVDLRIDATSGMTLAPARDYAPREHAETVWIINPGIAAELARHMVTAKLLRISYLDMVGAPHDADFNLEALSKVLAFTRTALDQPETATQGIGPPKSVAAAPPATRIDLIQRMGVPERLMARHLRAALACEDPASPRLKAAKPLIGAVSKVAILYAIPCIVTPAATAYRIWIIETGEIGGITPQYFALYDPKFGWKGSDLLYNVSYDEASGTLTSSAPREASACGHRASWHWKDYAFALQSFELTADCPGSRTPKIYPTK